MIYADQSGKRVTNHNRIKDMDVKEIKDVDNYSQSDLFRISTRVRFKTTQTAGWINSARENRAAHLAANRSKFKKA